MARKKPRKPPKKKGGKIYWDGDGTNTKTTVQKGGTTTVYPGFGAK